MRSLNEDAASDGRSNTVARFLAFGGVPYKKPSGQGGFLGWGARLTQDSNDPDADADAAYEAAAAAARQRALRRTEETLRHEAEAILSETLAAGTPVVDARWRAFAQTVRALPSDFVRGRPRGSA